MLAALSKKPSAVTAISIPHALASIPQRLLSVSAGRFGGWTGHLTSIAIS
jgi:hypothetical protein